MALLGKALKVAGKITGTALEYGLKATGEVVGMVAEGSNNYELADKSRKIGKDTGKFVGNATKLAGKGAGLAVDKGVELGSKAGEKVAECIAEANDLDEAGTRKAKIIGRAVGGGAVGFMAGDLIGSTIMAGTAAAGVSSTGTAISSLHGAAQTSATLAHIGGGAMSAGGGGMAAGQAILDSIDVLSSIAGGIDGVKKNNEEKIIEEKIIITCGKCSTKMRVPKGKGNIVVTCPKCSNNFRMRT